MMPLALTVLAYFCGSVPFGLILTKLVANKDVRESGSGNIGATNVARVAGKKLAALVLVLDAAKGSLPVWLATVVMVEQPWVHVAVAVAAFLGHVFPVWLKFQGGKGVATALGVLVVLLPVSAAIGFGTWVVMLLITRVSSVSSLVAGFFAIVSSFWWAQSPAYIALAVGLLLAMVWTHRANLKRLVNRTESKF